MEYAFGSLILIFLLITNSFMDRRLKKAESRLHRMERKLDAIIEEHGITVFEPELAKVDQLLADGKRIEAIRTYREITDTGLVEAKEAIDARENR